MHLSSSATINPHALAQRMSVSNAVLRPYIRSSHTARTAQCGSPSSPRPNRSAEVKAQLGGVLVVQLGGDEALVRHALHVLQAAEELRVLRSAIIYNLQFATVLNPARAAGLAVSPSNEERTWTAWEWTPEGDSGGLDRRVRALRQRVINTLPESLEKCKWSAKGIGQG